MAIKINHVDNTLQSSSGVITIDNSGALTLPVGNQARRPGTPTQGQIRFSTEGGENILEFYNGTSWVDLATGSGVAEPANQIVYGTGASVDSSVYFTYNASTGALVTNFDTGLVAPLVVGSPSDVDIYAASRTSTGKGGNINMYGGDGGSTSGNGGDVTLLGGNAQTSGNGGTVYFYGGGAAGTGVAGGGVSINAAGVSGSNSGGVVTINSGSVVGGGSTGNAGNITLTAGSAVDGNAGSVIINAGNTTGTGAGGNITLSAGGGASNGSVKIDSGNGLQSVTAGSSVQLESGGGIRLELTSVGEWLVEGSAGSAGYVLTSGGAGVAPSWSPSPSAGLTATYVGFGSGTNTLTGEADFTWTSATNVLQVGSVATPATIRSPDGSASAGANLSVVAGAGVGTDQAGGDVAITAGAATGTGTGGDVSITAGASPSGTDGKVVLTGGNGDVFEVGASILARTAGATSFRVDTNGTNNRFEITSAGEYLVAGASGTAGYVIKSAGAGLPTVWDSVTNALGFTPVNKAGDTGVGALTFASNVDITLVGGGEVLGLPAVPSTDSAAASKAYVDSVAAGLDPKESVVVATTVAAGNIPGYATTPNNGTFTVPNGNATYFPDSGLAMKVDGVTLANGDRVLVKNQTDAKQNGIYVVTNAGVQGTTDAVLTRAADQDGSPAGEVSGGNFTFVEEGTVNADTGWVVIGDGVLTLNTDPIIWTQFTGAGSFTAGTGLSQSGSTINLNLSAGELPAIGTAVEGADRLAIYDNGATSTGGVTVSTFLSDLNLSSTSNAVFNTVQASGVKLDDTDSIYFLTLQSTSTLGADQTLTIDVDAGSRTLELGNDLRVRSTSDAVTFNVTTPATNSVLIYNGTDWVDGSVDSALVLYSENPVSATAASATGNNTVALGNSAVSSIEGGLVYANGNFSVAGDIKRGLYILRGTTANNTLTELTTPARLVLANNSSWSFDVRVTGRDTTTGDTASYLYQGAIKRGANAAATTIVNAVAETIFAEDDTSWSAQVDADTTNGSLRVQVTGDAANTVRWVAEVVTTEIS